MKIHKGDMVIVISGPDKGAKGKVIEAYPKRDKVLVEGVNRIKKHVANSAAERGAESGGIVTQEAPIHVSNVQLLDGKDVTRIGFKREEATKRRPDGSTYTAQRSVRVSRKTGKEI